VLLYQFRVNENDRRFIVSPAAAALFAAG